MICGIRSLKNGTGSVLIGASIILLLPQCQLFSANENLPQTQENTSAVTKAPTETETSQTQTETPISEQKNANASLDSKKKLHLGNYYSARNNSKQKMLLQARLTARRRK